MFKVIAIIACFTISLLVSPSVADEFPDYDTINLISDTLIVQISNNGSSSKFILTTTMNPAEDMDSAVVWVAVGFNSDNMMVINKFYCLLPNVYRVFVES